MKKKLFKLISKWGYDPSYSGIRHWLICNKTEVPKCSKEELREHINDFLEKKCKSKKDIFFKELVIY